MNRAKKAPAPRPKGQGAAAARQMGLLLDLSPEGMDNNEDNADLEAELLAITGDKPSSKQKGSGKTPLPMEHIERMAALCMKDLDDEEEDDDEDLENDEDLMAELNDVLDDVDDKAPSPPKPSPACERRPQVQSAPSGMEESQESMLEERLSMYQSAIKNAKTAGEGSKARRYERGLKTLESMLVSVKKGKKINIEEIPPPVATGSKPAPTEALPPKLEPVESQFKKEEENATSLQTQATRPNLPIPSIETSPPLPSPDYPAPQKFAPPPVPKKPTLMPPTQPALLPKLSPSTPLQQSLASTPETPIISPLTPTKPPSVAPTGVKGLLLSRQREYKLAALQAKQSGDNELAKKYYIIAKKFDPVLESLDKGEPVDINNIAPPPGELVMTRSVPVTRPTPPASSPTPQATETALPPAPRNVTEALQQRMERYQSAAAQAKAKGDDRKARMHERIVKQYQDAIRAHKAGRSINLSELPVPPGFPPIQGTDGSGGDQSIMGVLETAMKLANQPEDGEEDEDGIQERGKPAGHPVTAKSPGSAQPVQSKGGVPAIGQGNAKPTLKLGTKAQQQLEFLEGRKKQLMQAALRSKQKNDLEGAKQHLRNAKGLDPMIEAAKGGLPVDITKVPPAPINEEDFRLVQQRGVKIPQKTAEQYTQLMELLKEQYDMCIKYSKQFTHLGNVAETTRFEKMAEDCKKHIDILKVSHGKGYALPKFHYEERTFNITKIFPSLSSSDMILTVVKGINLPAPQGVSPNDLDAFVRFEFPFPSSEEAQRDKTNTIRNTNNPEFKEQFKLNIIRGHRALKRVVQSKGIKFEVVHKGGLFKNDRVVGTGQLKLDGLESKCEIREIVELLEGRKPTGGKLDVVVCIREPLGGQQLESVTEKWLVIDPLTLPPVAVPKSKPKNDVSNSPPSFKLHSLSLLSFDKERTERKILEYKCEHREPPRDLLMKHRDLCQHIQWQMNLLEKPSPDVCKGYQIILEKFIDGFENSVGRFSKEGNRDAAKDALARCQMVKKELENFKRKRPS
ncbi:coiled-coil and C2 domain-containing protein 1A isoform X1 [Polypterus senegalus]|nr:coiled-coil and C2 domain-containing protein 1A isoform X1 [Polypterus senegalus]